MQPTGDTALSRPDLGQVAYEIQTGAMMEGYIGLSVMPIFNVPLQSASYPVIPKEALLNLVDDARTSMGGYRRGEEEFEEGFYATKERGREGVIDDRFRNIYKTKFDYEMTITTIKMNEILRARENRIASAIMNTSNFTPTNADTAWATIASADPKADIDAGKVALRAKGIMPDTLIINYTNYLYLTQNAALLDAVSKIFPDAAKTGMVSVNHIATYLDVPKILVGGALYNSAKRGQAGVIAELWGSRYAMLCKTASGDNADIIDPNIGRTVLWNEGSSTPIIVEEYRDEKVRADIIRVRYDCQHAFLASYDEDGAVKSEISKNAGYMIDTTAAS